MHLDLDDDETRALLNVLVEAIDADCYPLSRHPGEVGLKLFSGPTG